MEKKKFVKPSMKTVPLKTECLLASGSGGGISGAESLTPGPTYYDKDLFARKATKMGGSKSSKYQY